jgi:hypothetical protein
MTFRIETRKIETRSAEYCCLIVECTNGLFPVERKREIPGG